MIAPAVILLAAAAARANTSWVHGGNWADDDDNYQTGVIYLTGITSSTTTAQAATEADIIASDDLGAGINFVRIGINPATISGNWPVVQAYVNELIGHGMYVDLCCWTSSNSIGTITDESAWQSMWETVDSIYQNNNSVYYEPINEPFGYTSESQLATDVYVPFLGFINKSQNHIILDGTGYASDVTGVGADSRFTGCLLGLHDYGFWHTSLTTVGEWESQFAGVIGSYAGRTIMTEMGGPATTGLNYDAANSGNTYISYIQAMCIECQSLPMGFAYWPSHRANDTYRLFNSPGGGVTNPSLIDQLQYGWNINPCKPAAIALPTWNLRKTLTTGNPDISYNYGAASDTHLIMGDWDGNGSITPGVVRTNSSGQWEWFLRNENSSGNADYNFVYGRAQPGDILVVGDWDGNGTFTPGIVRTNANGQLEWLLHNANSSGNADYDFIYGRAGDFPIVGDWDGNGTWTCGVVRGKNWLLRISNTTGNADITFTCGNTGNKFLVWQ